MLEEYCTGTIGFMAQDGLRTKTFALSIMRKKTAERSFVFGSHAYAAAVVWLK